MLLKSELIIIDQLFTLMHNVFPIIMPMPITSGLNVGVM